MRMAPPVAPMALASMSARSKVRPKWGWMNSMPMPTTLASISETRHGRSGERPSPKAMAVRADMIAYAMTCWSLSDIEVAGRSGPGRSERTTMSVT